MLTPLIEAIQEDPECVSSSHLRAYVMNDLSIAYSDLGNNEKARTLLEEAIRIDLEAETSLSELGTHVGNYADYYTEIRRTFLFKSLAYQIVSSQVNPTEVAALVTSGGAKLLAREATACRDRQVCASDDRPAEVGMG